MIDDLVRLGELHNCSFSEYFVGEQEFVDLYCVNVLTRFNLDDIMAVLKQFGFYFYKVEALDDNLVITFYRK